MRKLSSWWPAAIRRQAQARIIGGFIVTDAAKRLPWARIDSQSEQI